METLGLLEKSQKKFCLGGITASGLTLRNEHFLSGYVTLAFLGMAFGHFQVPMEHFAIHRYP